MSRYEPWRWIWRTDDDWGFPFGLLDEGGPSLEDESWAKTRLAIFRMASDIYEMVIAFDGETAVISGRVTSEATRARIGRLIALQDLDVRNELTVHAPFKPADDTDYFADAGASAEKPTELVSRDAAIEADDDPVVGQPFEFTVDLRQVPHDETQSSPIVIKGAEAGWTELLIAVDVVAPRLRFEPGGTMGLIRLNAGGSSEPCRFVGMVEPDVGNDGVVDIMVYFAHERRHSGSARRAFQIQAATPSGRRATPVVQGTSAVDPDAERPTLFIRIVEGGQSGRYSWNLHAPGDIAGGDRRHDTIDLGDVRAFAQDLLKDCPDLQAKQLTHHLRGVGERIWERSPQCFRELYAGMREQHGGDFPIQLVTDDQFVPWELMYPAGVTGSGLRSHLCITHPISRWFSDIEGRMNAKLPRGKIASFVPVYQGGRTLQSAIDEGEWLVSELGALAHPSTYDDFMGFLGDQMPDPSVAVLHFAGHGSTKLDPEGSGVSGLEMSDENWVRENELHSGLTLGERDGSFVVLNACSAGVGAVELGCVAGFPAQFAKRGFRGVLAPIWAVRDSHASQVVCDQIRLLVSGATLGASMREARAIHQNASSTPYAYLCYGDVMAKMT